MAQSATMSPAFRPTELPFFALVFFASQSIMKAVGDLQVLLIGNVLAESLLDYLNCFNLNFIKLL